MTSIKFTIQGRIPSKKNSVILLCRGPRVMKFPSKAYKIWHEDASWQLKSFYASKALFPLKQISSMIIKIFAPDKRSADLSNKVESIMDLLVDNGILKDDNWFIVPNLLVIFCGIDKDNPRAEVEIKF